MKMIVAYFCESLIYLHRLHYRAINQLKKKFQDENSEIEANNCQETCSGNEVYDGKKRFAVRRSGRTQGQKNILSLK